MNRMTVSEFREGEKISTSALITQMTRGVTTSGAPYVSLQLQDQTGIIEAKMWDVKDDQLSVMEVGKVIHVSAEVLRYRNALQLRLYSVSPLIQTEFDPAEYISSTNLTNEYMKKRIEEATASLDDPIIREVCQAIMLEFADRLYTYPAAARNHHDFVGGLATHMIGMIDLAECMCKLYPLLNRDLLVAGVLLHDLGKMIELSGPILTEYTLEGKLIGHISIMQSKVNETASKLGCAETEQVTLLKHLILSHHGEYEYGSPILPMIMEAEILNYIDNIDARMNMFDKALLPIEPGNFTPRIFSLENRSFYKPSYLTKK